MNPQNVDARQRDLWRQAAAGWARWGDWYQASVEPLVEWICRTVSASPGMRVLDVAAGTGQPAISLASRVAPDGLVVATDISDEMLGVTRDRATAAGVRNLETAVMAAERLEFEDHSFDAVTCAFGLMFPSAPQRAVSEMRRVLVHDGTLAASVWDTPATNPFFSTMGGVLGRLVSSPPPAPDAPGAFRFADEQKLVALFRESGLRDVEVGRVKFEFDCGTVERYVRILTDCAPAIGEKAAGLSEEHNVELWRGLREACVEWAGSGTLRFPASALVARAKR